jgi:hypothetical protein
MIHRVLLDFVARGKALAQLGSIFYADEILLKCPSRYEEAVPDQAIN